MNLSESQVLVTGGGRGIGRHLVERLVVEAGRVAVFEKDEGRVADIAAAHPTVRCYPCDVTDPGAVSQAVAAMESDGFALDVLVNNAGLVHSASPLRRCPSGETINHVILNSRNSKATLVASS
jgi:NAD(P)-dependent dehydrogenase (short-subunit alcohol dehydrogenase family)